MEASIGCVNLIKQFEGLGDGDKTKPGLQPYLDPVGIPTLGYGCLHDLDGNKVTMKTATITESQAEQLLLKELKKYVDGVNKLVKVPLTQNQFDALVDFAYNCGLGNLQSSTLLKLVNAKDFKGAAEQFIRWNKARKNGVLVELAGLTRRRLAEKALFLK